ncbi:outer membrane protein assembly factor BamB [Catenovulum sp. SM1970]|uniref:outer membrane protein assembly factor BamB n=1 Tax=Marinifaba aquimaris TaxID=2741323 RepID=UPI00157360D4|nr:outer membrane protein assembly factor BamB [Marinifaba aquimaris]NTS75482.1 outer membrane protein assembly factor BamB [Marinifaba aquimaris]
MTLKTRLARCLSVSLVLGLAACASSDDVDPDTLPMPVPVVDSKIELDNVWQKSVSDGVQEYYSRLKPVIAYGKVFAASRSGDIFAYDQDTGEELWQADVRETPNGFWQTFWFDDDFTARVSGMASSYEKLYLGTEDGIVIALDEATGEQAWRVKVKGEVITTPEVDAGSVFIQTSSGLVYALDAQTGEETWQTESEVPPLSLRGASSPIYSAGGVIVGGAHGKITAYLAKSGQLAWDQAVSKPTGSTELERVVDIDATPIIIGTNIYALSYGGTLMALDIRDGRIAWKREYAGFEDISYSGNTLYLVDNQSNVMAIDRRNGIELWSNAELRNRRLNAPTVQAGYIVVGDFEGYLHWLDAETGEIIGQYQADDEAYFSSGIVDKERLYIQDKAGELNVIDIKSITAE